jgi:CrcB protein
MGYAGVRNVNACHAQRRDKGRRARGSLRRKRKEYDVGYLIVFVGAGIGGALRHAVNIAAARSFGTNFPYGTMFVNLAGALTMGLIVGYFAFKGEGGQDARLFLTTGILGGFTTFSAFSLDVITLIERGDIANAALYGGVSVVGSVLALYVGLWLTRVIF